MTSYLKKYPDIDGLDGIRTVTLMRQIAEKLDGSPAITMTLELDQLKFIAKWQDINLRFTYMIDAGEGLMTTGDPTLWMAYALEEFISKTGKSYRLHVVREKHIIMEELRRHLDERNIVTAVYHVYSTKLDEVQISRNQNSSAVHPYDLTVKYQFSYLYQQKDNLDSVVQELLKNHNDI